MFFTGDRHILTQRQPENRQFRPAKSLTGVGRRADRAMILNQQIAAVPCRLAARHIAFFATQPGQISHTAGKIGSLKFRVGLALPVLAGSNQPVQPRCAKQVLNIPDEFDSQIGMVIGEPRMAVSREFEQSCRPSTALADIFSTDQVLIGKRIERLVGTHRADIERLGDLFGAQRTALFQREKNIVGGRG